MRPRPPRSTLSPYTTLFQSRQILHGANRNLLDGGVSGAGRLFGRGCFPRRRIDYRGGGFAGGNQSAGPFLLFLLLLAAAAVAFARFFDGAGLHAGAPGLPRRSTAFE